jgi:hypothetical protein
MSTSRFEVRGRPPRFADVAISVCGQKLAGYRETPEGQGLATPCANYLKDSTVGSPTISAETLVKTAERTQNFCPSAAS